MKRKQVIAHFLSMMLIGSVALSNAAVPINAKAAAAVTEENLVTVEGESFPRDSVTGQPVFVYPEGEDPADYLEAFVDMLLGDMSIADKECYAYHALSLGGIEITVTVNGEEKTYIMPQSKGERDAVQGVSTDFPAITGLGQTWNKELVYEVGTVMGEEKRSTVESYDGMTMIYSAAGWEPSITRRIPQNGSGTTASTTAPAFGACMNISLLPIWKGLKKTPIQV